MAKIIEIKGIDETHVQKLESAGITTTELLLDQAATRQGRQALAKQLEIDAKLILAWVNRADLSRVKGIGEAYADLLEKAGVDTVPELAQRNPNNLHAKIVEINTAEKLVRLLPTAELVVDWVAQAKELPRVITY